MTSFVADDMVACTSAGARSISFVVKGNPTIQRRAVMTWKGRSRPVLFDPSSRTKLLFRDAVRKEMAVIGLPTEAYFNESTAIKMNVKFVIPRPKKDFVRNKLTAGAMSFPRGKDIDNLLKFVMDALEQTLYMNDTNIVHVECEKCYCSDTIVDKVGWTELLFRKVVCIE
jgi:Holliday junction resolvase RusA-like endonuclease